MRTKENILYSDISEYAEMSEEEKQTRCLENIAEALIDIRDLLDKEEGVWKNK